MSADLTSGRGSRRCPRSARPSTSRSYTLAKRRTMEWCWSAGGAPQPSPKFTSNYSRDQYTYYYFVEVRRKPIKSYVFNRITSFAVLLKYLTDTPVSPLQREFVECEDSFASTVSTAYSPGVTYCEFDRFDLPPHVFMFSSPSRAEKQQSQAQQPNLI